MKGLKNKKTEQMLCNVVSIVKCLTNNIVKILIALKSEKFLSHMYVMHYKIKIKYKLGSGPVQEFQI